MLYERKQLSELHDLKHRHDTFSEYVNYEDKILTSSLVPYIFENALMREWLTRMQGLVSILFDQFNVIKNFKNYTVDKYYYKHSK